MIPGQGARTPLRGATLLCLDSLDYRNRTGHVWCVIDMSETKNHGIAQPLCRAKYDYEAKVHLASAHNISCFTLNWSIHKPKHTFPPQRPRRI